MNGLQVLLFWYRNQIYCIEARSPAEGAYSEGFIKAKFTQVRRLSACDGAQRTHSTTHHRAVSNHRASAAFLRTKLSDALPACVCRTTA